MGRSKRALAPGWLKENGCVSEGSAAQMRSRFVKGLVAEAAKAPADDVGIEAMAMLDYLGEGNRIEPA